jgi:hypothetical protein
MVQGLSIANALRRCGVECDYTIVHNSHFSHLAEYLNVQHRRIEFEKEEKLSRKNFSSSQLYNTIRNLNPDILIVDLFWFMVHCFLDEFPCKKIYLCRQIEDRTFSIELPWQKIVFNPRNYDIVLATEPFESSIEMKSVNPLIIRNRDEVLPRNEARDTLGIAECGNTCLFAFNGKPGEFERIRKDYSYLEDAGYHMVYSTNFREGLFPAVDYFNAFDLLICGAGYNAFWEAVYFEKEALFVPVPRRFEDQKRRIEEYGGYRFDENGADQLVDLMLAL